MNKMPEKLCFCSLLARPTSLLGQEWAVCMVQAGYLRHPWCPDALSPGQTAWRQPNPSAKSLESPIPTTQPRLHPWQSEWQLWGLSLLPFAPAGVCVAKGRR